VARVIQTRRCSNEGREFPFLPRPFLSAVFAGRAASVDQRVQFIYDGGKGRKLDRMSFL
jgi:hypothetical protein